MSSGFIYNATRISTVNEHQWMIEGFCAPDFMDGRNVSAIYEDAGNKAELPVSFTAKPRPLMRGMYVKDEDVRYKVTFAVDMPETVSERARLRIVVDDRTVYTCSGRKLTEVRSRVNAYIEETSHDDRQRIVKGWCVDAERISVDVLDAQGMSHKDEAEIKWQKRPDVTRQFDECDPEKEVGFTVCFPAEIEKPMLVLTAGDRKNQYPIERMGADASLPRKLGRYVRLTANGVKKYGIAATVQHVKLWLARRTGYEARQYCRWLKKQMPSGQELEEQRTQDFAYRPLFSILVPMYETEERFLQELVRSVQAQTYENWELCLSDGSRDAARLRAIVGNYAAKDSRIRYVTGDTLPLGISDNTNQALGIARGDYIVLGDHDDLFTPDALYECVRALNQKRVDVIYTDEDKIDADGKLYFDPNFKPDFNPDLLRSCNYITHMFVASKTLIDKVGAFRREYDGAQDYDFILRCTEQADGICHIPKILYHWRSHAGSTAEKPEAKLYAYQAGKHAVEAHYQRLGIEAAVEQGEHWGFYRTTYAVTGEPLVSVVICDRDHTKNITRCIESLDKKSEYRNCEYVIVACGKRDAEMPADYEALTGRENVRIVCWNGSERATAISNFGARQAKGEYLLFLDSGTEILNGDLLTQMLGVCRREEVGAVGARIYEEDGRIRHAGMVIGLGGAAGSVCEGLREEDGIYQARTKTACDYNAVSAECLMIKKELYEQLGGMDEEFETALYDADLCLRIRELGKLVVYNPEAKLLYHAPEFCNAKSSEESKASAVRDAERFRARWQKILRDGDPYYNPNLTLDRTDFSYRV